MQCEMCGKDTELVISLVEGTELKVCNSCAGYGKVLRRAPRMMKEDKKIASETKPKLPEKEVIEVVVEDCGKRVKEAREKRGLTQEEFAKSLNEKEAIIHKIESGRMQPNILLVRKLERALGVKLVESHEEVHGQKNKQQSEFFTIGDIINIKK